MTVKYCSNTILTRCVQRNWILQPPEVVTSVNPVYDNKGFTGGDEYAVVQKPYRPQEPIPVSPPIVPVMVPAVDDGGLDVYIAEPIPEVPAEPIDFDEPEEPEPVIITEPIMSDETFVSSSR